LSWISAYLCTIYGNTFFFAVKLYVVKPSSNLPSFEMAPQTMTLGTFWNRFTTNFSREISARAHSVEYKEVLWWLRSNQFKVHLMWILAHVRFTGMRWSTASLRIRMKRKVCFTIALGFNFTRRLKLAFRPNSRADGM
jgi:hypothetical protein